jgi:hypothetical protein
LAAGIEGFGSGGVVVVVELVVVDVVVVDVVVVDVVVGVVVDVVDVVEVVVAGVVVVDAGGAADWVSADEVSAQPATIRSPQVIRATDRVLTPVTIGSAPGR